MRYKIGVIGDKDSVYAFAMLGLETFFATEAHEAEALIKQLESEDYGVIYITEQLAEQIPVTIRRYDDQFLPAIILIPSHSSTSDIGLQRVQENVKKAIGMNIL